ncbi:MAG: hypothetical protein IPP72_03475 [Chitinophagaceae bacterium]|nr:hypothetical protein [Chitinophagaceae bacterium]
MVAADLPAAFRYLLFFKALSVILLYVAESLTAVFAIESVIDASESVFINMLSLGMDKESTFTTAESCKGN